MSDKLSASMRLELIDLISAKLLTIQKNTATFKRIIGKAFKDTGKAISSNTDPSEKKVTKLGRVVKNTGRSFTDYARQASEGLTKAYNSTRDYVDRSKAKFNEVVASAKRARTAVNNMGGVNEAVATAMGGASPVIYGSGLTGRQIAENRRLQRQGRPARYSPLTVDELGNIVPSTSRGGGGRHRGDNWTGHKSKNNTAFTPSWTGALLGGFMLTSAVKGYSERQQLALKVRKALQINAKDTEYLVKSVQQTSYDIGVSVEDVYGMYIDLAKGGVTGDLKDGKAMANRIQKTAKEAVLGAKALGLESGQVSGYLTSMGKVYAGEKDKNGKVVGIDAGLRKALEDLKILSMYDDMAGGTVNTQQILSGMRRGAGTGRTLGMSSSDYIGMQSYVQQFSPQAMTGTLGLLKLVETAASGGKTKTQIGALASLGYSQKSLKQDMKDDASRTIMTLMYRIKALSKEGKDAEPIISTLADLAGVRAKDLVTVVDNIEGMAEYLKIGKEGATKKDGKGKTQAQLKYEASVANYLQTLEPAMQRVAESYKIFSDSFIKAVEPALVVILNGLSWLMKHLGDFFRRYPKVTATLAGLFTLAITPILWSVAELFLGRLTGVGFAKTVFGETAGAGVLKGVGNSIKGAVTFQWVQPVLTFFSVTLPALLKSTWTWIVGAVPVVFNSIVAFLGTTAGIALAWVVGILVVLGTLWWLFFTKSGSQVRASVWNGVSGFFKYLGDQWNAFWAWAGNTMASVMDGSFVFGGNKAEQGSKSEVKITVVDENGKARVGTQTVITKGTGHTVLPQKTTTSGKPSKLIPANTPSYMRK